LNKRGISFKEAIIAAGCTRLRPVLLTAITTILGLLPMVTGVAYNFHEMKISWISTSTQWWSSMASAVIFGLALATVLTLVVVPTLYALIHTSSLGMASAMKRIQKAYWKPFYRITGIPEEKGE
jgi:multidrug efflux pump subunit AcrB